MNYQKLQLSEDLFKQIEKEAALYPLNANGGFRADIL